ncbi:MAG TPA: carboxypeptidase-like regulatory domain-containing protein [Solirubrobacter sp.]|nr:carboxypeptidase-like regulatory domain-containing protein [Solirubrobacter sp.]
MDVSRTHRSEAGFALIEVIVSAAVLAIVALAVLAGIDGATASSAREKARAVAGALAEQDQERMRSYRFDALATIPQHAPVEVDGVTYTIKSEAKWITDDANATPACGGSSQNQSEYLKITTTVTSNVVGTRIDPIKIESLVAPSVTYAQDHGTLVVKVVDRNLEGVPNITVNAKHEDGTMLSPQETNDQGCALFRSVKVGDYAVELNTPGYISPKGDQLAKSEVTVNPNYVNVATITYDHPVTMKVDVKTIRPGATFSATETKHPSKALAVSDNSAEATVLRTFKRDDGAAFTSIETPKLFPFRTTLYSYFTGTCAYESPVKWVNDYFTTVNPDAAVKGDPDSLEKPQLATVYQPAFNVRVRWDSGQNENPSNSRVKAYVTLDDNGDSCKDVQDVEMKFMDYPAAWGNAPAAPANKNFLSQAGTDFDPGMPFGTYEICLYDSSGSWNRRYWSTTYDNTSPSGQPTTLEIPPSKTTRWRSSC